jgi:hypothetical protein
MIRPFELAVQHLQNINGPFELDLGILRDGFVDLQTRLHRLEAYQQPQASSKPPATSA